MKRIIFSLCLMSTFSQLSLAHEKLTLKETGQLLSRFYQTPTKENFDTIQKNVIENIKEIPSRNTPQLAVWAIKVNEVHGWEIKPKFYPKLIAALQDKSSKQFAFVSNDNSVTPGKLDMWWASFSATGDTQYARKVFQHIGIDKGNKDAGKLLISQASNWSFGSNCKMHKILQNDAKKWLNDDKLNESQKQSIHHCLNKEDK